jgi:hypothetical protein
VPAETQIIVRRALWVIVSISEYDQAIEASGKLVR